MGDITSFEGMDVQAQPADLGIPLQFQHDNHVDPWAPEFMFFDMEDVSARMSRTTSQGSAAISSLRSSPKIPSAKPRHSKDADPVKKVRGGGRVEKKKKAAAPATTSDNFVIFTPNSVNNQPGKPNLFECFEVAGGVQRGRKGPLAGKAAERARNIRRMGACFCCRRLVFLSSMLSVQVPLTLPSSILQAPTDWPLFAPPYSRKVSCDEERPCKNCKKISTQLPQVVCWQFSDFLPVLFPGFIRGHFKKDAMTRFISDNVSKFYSVSSSSSTSSSSSPWLIELSSGLRFHSTLILPASFCAPKSAEVLHHWHVSAGESAHHLDLYSRLAVPVGIDPKDSNQREALRRRTREYIASLVSEPLYAAQVTDSLRGTKLPQRVLEIVQRYAQRSSHHSSAAMVKRALGIYAAHYVLTRQLCLTPATLDRLHHLQQTQPEKLPFLLSPGIISAHHSSFTTTRILNRQIKAVLDEFLLKETQSLFTSFGAALKPRSRAEWASCLASFLVLCLLFEGIEAAADIFMVSEAEVALRSRRRSNSIINANNSVFDAAAATTTTTTTDANKPGGFAVGGRRQALEVCREIDNLPFRQVAYRFHAVYQTHHVREPGVGCPMGSSSTTTTTTSSSAGGNSSSGAGTGNGNGNGGSGGAGLTFNPLLDPSLDADLEPAAAEMAASLRSLLDIDGSCE